MSNQLADILEKHWGYQSFRPMQEDVIRHVLEGKDTLALLPTGGGKSICFQVPALAKEGICIVVSPLIALMKDQVENLKKREIKALSITSELKKRKIDYLLDNCIYGEVKFLYISPERLLQPLFIERFKQMNVNLIAIDEAHCVSQWGYDFRPPYLAIKNLRKYHPNVPFLALTATATKEVVEDIQIQLEFKAKSVYQKSFYRSNLQYVVLKEEDSLSALIRVLKNVKGSGIVYVRTRRETKEIAQLLAHQHFSVTNYHAGLPIEERNQKQKDWQSNKTLIMVSTNAFGMGIDKPDVRFVVNLGAPDSLEAYFQEAGRAGRDEKKAYAVLIVNEKDKLQLQNNIELKFPTRDTVKKVYYAICNYLRIATGAGNELQIDIDFKSVSESFDLKLSTIIYAFPFLERAGYFSLSTSVNYSSTLQFLMQGKDLYEFQVRNKVFDSLIKLLLRSYSGMFDTPARIKEADIGNRFKISKDKVKLLLLELHKLEVVEYKPSSNLPILTFLQPRIDQKLLRIPKSIFEDRKELAQTKVNTVIDYAFENKTCRSVTLLTYFNDTTAKPCGKCDVCLANKKQIKLSNAVFKQIEQTIYSVLKVKEIAPKELINALRKGYSKEEILFVIKWLFDNEQLTYNDLNQIKIID